MESIFQTLAGTYCSHTDSALTLKTSCTNISEVTGYSDYELEVNFQNHLLDLVLPEDRQTVQKQIAEQLHHSDNIELTYKIRHKNGFNICILNKGKRVVDSDNQEYIYGILTDVTMTYKSNYTTQKLLQQYQIILSQTENIVFELDIKSDTIFFSNTWKRIFGYEPSTQNFFSTLPTVTHIHKDDLPLLYERFKILANGVNYQSIDLRIAKLDGTYLWCRVRATGVYDESDQLIKIIGIIINVDHEKRVTDELQQKAECDALTKLLNPVTARKQVKEYLNAHSKNSNCALLVIDMDNFKYVNDHFGHLYGDYVLIEAANEIKKLFRSNDIVARIGGDEFMVLMKDVTERTLIEKRCKQLISAVHTIFQEKPTLENSSCSIGVAFSPEHGITYSDLFQHADEALYEAKALGKGRYSIYQEPTTNEL